MLKVYANDALLGGQWLLGQEGEDSGGDGGSGLPSMSDISSGISKVGGLIKQGQSAISTVTGGGTKTAGAKPQVGDPYFHCYALKGLALSQCKYKVDRAIALRARASKKTSSTSKYLLIAAGLAAVGGAAWWFLK